MEGFVDLVVLLFCLRSTKGAKGSETLRFVVVELTSEVTPYSHSAIAVLSAEAHSIEQHGQQDERQEK